MISKLRPVGNPIPLASLHKNRRFPWEPRYATRFVSSGTAALAMAVLAAVKWRPGCTQPEVIIPAYCCPDLVTAIVAQGATPVPVDFCPSVPRLDLNALQQAISDSTVAIVAVNFLGYGEDLGAIAQLCADRQITLIDDSAQSYPPASSYGAEADFSILSFGRGKPINLTGGGALLVRKDHMAELDRGLECYPLKHLRAGRVWQIRRAIFNALLQNRICYGLLERSPFLHLGETRLKPMAPIYRLELNRDLVLSGAQCLQELAVQQRIYVKELLRLEALEWKLINVPASGGKASNTGDLSVLRFAFLAPSRTIRDQAVCALNDRGIGANDFYGKPVARIPGVEDLVRRGGAPNAEDFAARLLTLPAHEGVESQDVAAVVGVLGNLITGETPGDGARCHGPEIP
ncbi:aminotransferase class V-fold PLP-dependent enzyme [Marinobacter sp. C7]|uniref:DegT/DnrJ/EryC1/StrS family aminotransferase n=1 Tax=Marinobacter sp. C7 TaxID=2951363 RepID=UPI002551FED1|nr:aminotransferase class V-fold PLP-dependent enzyme [Marinobacter sp. C7]